jgi:xanthine phosphoribosyltransferase
MDKIHYTWNDTNAQVAELAHQIIGSKWQPDYIVGITRGGIIPAVMLSHYLQCQMHTLDVRLRDSGGGDGPESNAWMAEDAFGYVDDQKTFKNRWDPAIRKNILIVDDINDTGATFNWIKKDWQSLCLPNEGSWDTVWGKTVRFAVLTNNLASPVAVDYAATEVNKAEKDCWLVYPWEHWWKL